MGAVGTAFGTSTWSMEVFQATRQCPTASRLHPRSLPPRCTRRGRVNQHTTTAPTLESSLRNRLSPPCRTQPQPTCTENGGSRSSTAFPCTPRWGTHPRVCTARGDSSPTVTPLRRVGSSDPHATDAKAANTTELYPAEQRQQHLPSRSAHAPRTSPAMCSRRSAHGGPATFPGLLRFQTSGATRASCSSLSGIHSTYKSTS
mmetsp:Transcript_4361/g.8384  ORF Transcript_4361/g.8384 Transcript_4361/m.8384 type:complete len:202 (-) Transcript_4361:420-1025(-)